MVKAKTHSFHIPVMGTAFSIDTPLKVGQFGIDGVMQIMDDYLCERMRKFYSHKYDVDFVDISNEDTDYRALRITAYLNTVDIIIQKQIAKIKSLAFEAGTDLTKYFSMLADDSPLKLKYTEMLSAIGEKKEKLQTWLKEQVKPGSINVNIMVAVDRDKLDENGVLIDAKYSDAMSALRGFAKSTVDGAVVLSAGFNRRLNTYMEDFSDFFPDALGNLKKRLILKVSDHRSAIIQGKLFSKKGIWVSEFRVESGLNCGGHLFPSEGYLMGPILEEFKSNRAELYPLLLKFCNA